jgi:hypothetical protein
MGGREEGKKILIQLPNYDDAARCLTQSFFSA